MSTYDVLSRYPSGAVLRLSGLLMVALVVRLVAVPLAVAALLAGRLVVVVDAAITSRPTTPPAPPSPPRWTAANTRTRHTATV